MRSAACRGPARGRIDLNEGPGVKGSSAMRFAAIGLAIAFAAFVALLAVALLTGFATVPC